jgi:hypothetical protein
MGLQYLFLSLANYIATSESVTGNGLDTSYAARRLQAFNANVAVKAPPATGSNPFAPQFRQTVTENALNICTATAGGDDCPYKATSGDPFLQVASVYGRDGTIAPTSTFTFKAGLGLSSTENTCAAAAATCAEVIASGLNCNSCRIVGTEPVITIPAGATVVFDPPSYTARRLQGFNANVVVKAPPATGSNPFAPQFSQTITVNAENICIATAGGEDCLPQQTTGNPFLQVASVYGRDGAIAPTSTFTFKAGLGLSSTENTCAAASIACAEVITRGLNCNACRIVVSEPVITVPFGATIVFDPPSYTARRLGAAGDLDVIV